MNPPPVTLARQLAPAAVDFATLHRRHGPLLALVRRLIGVVPNCDPYLEIWPTGFRTYNLMVPNLLNLPQLLLGQGAPRQVLGLAMYASSRAAACAYCSAHTCAFALRRGAPADKVAAATAALDGQADRFDPGERAAIGAAVALSSVPATFGAAEREALARHYRPAEIDWLVLGVAMMGFLNKFMDALGVPLEEETVAEVTPLIAASGWSPGKHQPSGTVGAGGGLPAVDSWRTLVAIAPHLPGALRRDRRWTAGVPSAWPRVGQYLAERAGHDYPLLGRLSQPRVVRTLATMLRDNLDPSTTLVGLEAKRLAAIVFATVVGNPGLVAEAREVAARSGARAVDAVAALAAAPGGCDTSEDLRASAAPLAAAGLADPTVAALLLAKAASFSPARVSEHTLAFVGDRLAPGAVVELLVWLSLQQLLHRLASFYAA
jgi:alkylhydroperoxidase family enzyme